MFAQQFLQPKLSRRLYKLCR